MNQNQKDFDQMSREDKVNLVQQIDAIAKECEIDLTVELYRETVCALVGNPEVSDKQILRAEKSLPSSDSEKVKNFNEKVKPLTEGLKGVSLNVVSKLGPGDMY